LSAGLEIALAALAMTLPVAVCAHGLGRALPGGPRADRTWAAASLAAMAPLVFALAFWRFGPPAASGFDPAWFEGLREGVPALAPPEAARIQQGAADAPGLAIWLAGVWLAGAVWRGLFEAARSWRLERLLARSAGAPCGLADAMRTLLAEAGLPRAPAIRVFSGNGSPFSAGIIRPVVAVPAGWLAPERAGALRCALIHELTHVKRGDARAELAARAAGILLWFNPFWFAIQRRRRGAVETACDATALEVIGHGGARLYARTLLDAARASSGRSFTVSLGVADKRIMEMRLKAILNSPPKQAARRGAGLLSAVALLAVALPAAAAQAMHAAAAQAISFSQPVLDGKITSRFGPSSLSIRPQKFHNGYDIAAPRGTTIAAPADGRVSYADENGLNGKASYGQVIVLDHGEGFTTLYAHMDGFTVMEGDRVTAGDPIGFVGSSGVSTGPHLHVEVRRDGEPVDPALYLPGLAQD